MGVCAVEIRGCHKTAGAVFARASAARRARRAAHRMCAVQFALISTICPSFSLNMTGTSKQELKMHAQAQPERPRQSTALPSENGPTLMSALGCKGIIIAAGRQRQQRSEVAGATCRWPEFLFASNGGQTGGAISNFRFHDFLPRRLHGLAPTPSLSHVGARPCLARRRLCHPTIPG